MSILLLVASCTFAISEKKALEVADKRLRTFCVETGKIYLDYSVSSTQHFETGTGWSVYYRNIKNPKESIAILVSKTVEVEYMNEDERRD